MFNGTKVVTTNDPQEINSALFDLLAKINTVQSGIEEFQKTLLVKDSLGNAIHSIPNESIFTNSYPMGHLYLFNYDNAQYTLANSLTAGWNTLSTQNAGQAKINGVRIKILCNTPFTAGGVSIEQLLVSARPYGSSWGVATNDMSPQVWQFISANDANFRQYNMITMLDVPVGELGKIDVYSSYDIAASGVVQQLGIWI